MKKFKRILKKLKKENTKFVIAINGKEVEVKIADHTEDHVVIHCTESDERFDLHYRNIVIVGKQS